MKKIFFYITFILTLTLVACSDTDKGEFVEVDSKNTGTESEKPSLTAKVEVDGNNALVYVDTNLEISKKEYGKEKKHGQGHIHMYVDDGEKQGITATPVKLENLTIGSHKVKISLHNNDHTPYDVTKIINFAIK
jgi:hypothetical protein